MAKYRLMDYYNISRVTTGDGGNSYNEDFYEKYYYAGETKTHYIFKKFIVNRVDVLKIKKRGRWADSYTIIRVGRLKPNRIQNAPKGGRATDERINK